MTYKPELSVGDVVVEAEVGVPVIGVTKTNDINMTTTVYGASVYGSMK